VLFSLFSSHICKGLSIKDVRSQKDGVSGKDILLTRGGGGSSSDAEVRTFWCKKTSDILKFMLYPHGQEGKDQFFTILFGYILWTALNFTVML